MNPSPLLTTYKRNANLLLRNIEGLTHENSLWTPAENVNSVNWLVGHLISGRMNALKAVGQRPIWTEEERWRYKNGSQPVTSDGEGVLQLSDLAELYKESQARLEAGFETVTPELLASPSPFSQFPTIADQLLYHHAHEMSHIGQIMTLRELIGMPSIWE